MKAGGNEVEESGAAKVWISDIVLSDGTKFDIPKSGVVILVGPNNAGKSQSLKDLQGLARHGESSYKPRSIVRSTFNKDRALDIGEWVSRTMPSVMREGVPHHHVEGWALVPASTIVNQWTSDRLDVLTHMFILFADGTSRLVAGNSQSNIDFSTEPPTHPIQHAYMKPDLERELGGRCRAAFGLDVTVDRLGGSVISLRLGDRPHYEHDSGIPTTDYLNQLKSLPKLEEQGDGIRSYMGLILHILAGMHEIMLVDEPEAFLHPPQARLLAKVLAEQAEAKQVFLATHSSDIVQGALEAGGSTTIVRITRHGDVNHAAMLKDEDVKDLWSDPLLRYSSVLDGLFHDAVILCESDSDCRYYQAVLDGIRGPSIEGGSSREPQLLFTHCGGKARLASVVNALRAVSVPVVVVADFDILRSASDVERLVVALGGDFELVRTDLTIVSAQLTSDVKPLRKLALKDELLQRIDANDGQIVDVRAVRDLRAMLHSETGWDKAKRSGISAVPHGEARAACERLAANLKGVGLLVVPVGELEGFAPAIGGHGPAWVTEVLQNSLHVSPSRDAHDFVTSIRATAAAVMAAQ